MLKKISWIKFLLIILNSIFTIALKEKFFKILKKLQFCKKKK